MYSTNFDDLKISFRGNTSNYTSLVLNIAGDWAPALGGISEEVINTQESFYGDLANIFKKADYNIINLESVIDTEQRRLEKASVRLIDKPEVLSSLSSINVHLACLANNHIMDNGIDGLSSTIKYLKEYGIDYVGAGLSHDGIYATNYFEKNQQRIAVINAAEGEEANEKYNDHVGASDIESYRIIDQIRASKKKGYFTIVIAHAGVEFIPVPPPHISELYRIFVDEGADLVVGHHPHVPQGFEIYKKSPIFYSLGNFGIYRSKSRKMERIGFNLNIHIKNNHLSEINVIPYSINKDGLNVLMKEGRDDFIKLFQKSSNILNNTKKLKDMWYEYSNERYGVLEFMKIVDFHKLSKEKSRALEINFASQYSRRLLHLAKSRGSSKKYSDYLNDFGCGRKLRIRDKIFLFCDNKLNTIYSVYLSFLYLLKKLMKKYYFDK